MSDKVKAPLFEESGFLSVNITRAEQDWLTGSFLNIETGT